MWDRYYSYPTYVRLYSFVYMKKFIDRREARRTAPHRHAWPDLWAGASGPVRMGLLQPPSVRGSTPTR